MSNDRSLYIDDRTGRAKIGIEVRLPRISFATDQADQAGPHRNAIDKLHPKISKEQ